MMIVFFALTAYIVILAPFRLRIFNFASAPTISYREFYKAMQWQ